MRISGKYNINMNDVHDAVVIVIRLRLLSASGSPGCSARWAWSPERLSGLQGGGVAGQSISGPLKQVLVLLELLVPSTVLLSRFTSFTLSFSTLL